MPSFSRLGLKVWCALFCLLWVLTACHKRSPAADSSTPPVIASSGGGSAIPPPAPAGRSGIQDTAFGQGGLSLINYGVTPTYERLFQQPDGKWLTLFHSAGANGGLAERWIVRHTVEGRLDTNWGTQGVRRMASVGGSLVKVLSQPEGKTILVSTPEPNQILITRLGSSGEVEAVIPLREVTRWPEAFDALAQPDGKILLAGSRVGALPTDYKEDILFRLNANGTYDFSFNGTGRIFLPYVPRPASGISKKLILQSDGKILLVYGTPMQVLRYNPDGSLDSAFGNGGRLSLAAPDLRSFDGILSYPENRILIWGKIETTTGLQWCLIRFQADGALDTTFGNNGRLFDTTGSNGQLAKVMVEADGSLLIGAATFANGSQDMLVARYFPTGMLDANFGNNGVRVIEISGGSETMTSLSLSANRQWLYVVGRSDNRLVAARLAYRTGEWQKDYGRNGIFTFSPPEAPFTPEAPHPALDAGNGLVMGGIQTVGGAPHLFLMRLTP